MCQVFCVIYIILSSSTRAFSYAYVCDAARATTIHLKGPRQKFNVESLTLYLEVKCFITKQ